MYLDECKFKKKVAWAKLRQGYRILALDYTQAHLSVFMKALGLLANPYPHAVISVITYTFLFFQKYDDNGSNIRCFANGYVRITHKVKFSSCEEVTPVLRENISDIMFHEGWDLIGFAAHQGPSQNTTSTTVVEKWVKSRFSQQNQSLTANFSKLVQSWDIVQPKYRAYITLDQVETLDQLVILCPYHTGASNSLNS